MDYTEALTKLGEALADPHPTLTVADLDLELRTSPAATLWTTDNSVVFLRLESYENGVRALWAAPAAGDLEEILEHGTHAVEETARENGCSQVLIQAGRKGWARALKAQGYEEVAVVLRKVLD